MESKCGNDADDFASRASDEENEGKANRDSVRPRKLYRMGRETALRA